VIKALRVETAKADLAHHESLFLALTLQEGNRRALVPPGTKLHAAALAAVAGRRNVVRDSLGARVHVRDQAPSLVLDALAKQDASPQHVEAVAPACPVNLLSNPVQRLGVGVRDGVLEEGQNLLPPVLHGGEQDLEVRFQPLRHLGGVGIKGSGGFVLRHLVDGVEGLLQPIGVSQLGFVVQPHVPVEALLLAQPGGAHVQNVLGLEPVPAHASLAGLLEPDADPLHAVVRHPDHVELVHHQGDTGHHEVRHLAVRAPHVGGHALDHAPVLVPGQPVDDGHLAAVLEHVDGLLVAHVCNDTAHLPVNLGLVNTQPLGEGRLVVGFQFGYEVAGENPDGFVVAPDILSNADEGLGQAAVGDERATALRHAPVSQDAAQGLQERLGAVPAPVALHLGNQLGGSAPDWAVHVTNGLRPVSVQVANATTLGAGIGLDGVGGLNDEHVAIRSGASYVPIWEVEDVCHSGIMLYEQLGLGCGTLFLGRNLGHNRPRLSYALPLQCLVVPIKLAAHELTSKFDCDFCSGPTAHEAVKHHIARLTASENTGLNQGRREHGKMSALVGLDWDTPNIAPVALAPDASPLSIIASGSAVRVLIAQALGALEAVAALVLRNGIFLNGDVVEVISLRLGKQKNMLMRTGAPVGHARWHAVRLLPNYVLAKHPAISLQGQCQTGRNHQQVLIWQTGVGSSSTNSSIPVEGLGVLPACGPTPLTASCVAVADINPESPVISEHIANAPEHLNEFIDVLLRGIFQTNLSLDAVVTQAEVRRTRYAHLRLHAGDSHSSKALTTVTKVNDSDRIHINPFPHVYPELEYDTDSSFPHVIPYTPFSLEEHASRDVL